MLNPFFKNTGPFNIEKLLSNTDIKNIENFKKDKIYNVSDLVNASNKDLTFFLRAVLVISFAVLSKSSTIDFG